MKHSTLSIAVLTLLASPGSSAEKTTLNQVVVTANQSEQLVKDITADFTIITAEEIATKNFTTIVEALNQIPGLSFDQSGPLGTASSLYLRGSSSLRTLVLIDGVRYQDPSSINGANLADLMISNIARIEVIKGAQSGVWGADAAAGVINIITKSTDNTQINIEYGAYNMRKASIASSIKLDKLNLSLNAQRLTSDGFSAQAPYGTDIDLYEEDGYTNTNISFKAGIDLGRKDSLLLVHNHINAAANYDGFASPDSTKRSESISNLTSLHYSRDQTNVALEQSYFQTDQLDEPNTDRMEGTTQSAQITHKINTFLLGANHSTNSARAEKPVTSYPSPSYLPAYSHQRIDTKDTHSNSLFVTNAHAFKGLTFNEAIRWDNYSNFDSQFTGKIGLKKTITQTSAITLNYGTAYNAPSITQMINPWGDANLNLKPESAEEASIRYQNSGFKATIFDKRVKDLIGWENSQYVNQAKVTKIHGYELEYTRSIASVDISTNWTHLYSRDSEGKALSRRPENQLGLSINWYATDKLDFNLNGQYIGKRTETVSKQIQDTGFYSVFNFNTHYQINKQLSTYLKVNNLFDTYYQTAYGFSSAERSAYLGLKAQF